MQHGTLIYLLFQAGNYIVPNNISGIIHRQIRAVRPPGNSQIFQVLFNFPTGHAQKRPDNPSVHRPDRREPPKRRSPCQMKQSRFRQIVLMMSQGNSGCPIFPYTLFEHLPSCRTASLFQSHMAFRCHLRHRARIDKERYPPLSAKFFCKLLIAIALRSPQPMVHMHRLQPEGKLPGKLLQQQQQAHRIRAAGKADAKHVTRLRHFILFHKLQYFFSHGNSYAFFHTPATSTVISSLAR